RVTGERSIHLSIPYKSPDGLFDGVIALVLNPDTIGQEFAERSWRIFHRIMVIDREGSLVLTIPESADAALSDLAKQLFEKVSGGSERTLVFKDARGDDQIIGIVPLEDLPHGLFVAVAIDRDVALTEFNVTARRSAVFGALALLFAIAGI